MSEIKGSGLPSNYLEASIGDIYIDDTIGKAYKCTFAYHDSLSDSIHKCQWIAAPDKDIPIKKQNNNCTQKETK